MSSINKSVNVERRTWDKEAFEARARSRAAAAAAVANTSAAAPAGHRVAGSGDYADDGIDNNSSNNSIIKNQLLSTNEDQKEEFLPAQALLTITQPHPSNHHQIRGR